MFQNAYQAGAFLEVFDAKGTSHPVFPLNPLASKDKDKNYEKLFKTINPTGVIKVYDKFIKGIHLLPLC